MKIEHCYHSTAREWVEKALQRVPKAILEILSEVKIFLFRSDASVNGLIPRTRLLADGRPSCHYSHFNPEMNAIFLFQRDLFVSQGEHNMLFHEMGHALDWVLGENGYISNTIDCGEPLDSHSARNPQEQFAQAFEAWLRGDEITPKGEFAHRASEVKEKAPVLFELFQKLVEGRSLD